MTEPTARQGASGVRGDETSSAPVERIARYLAAKDYLADERDDAWWASRLPRFRADYRACAAHILTLTHHTGDRS